MRDITALHPRFQEKLAQLQGLCEQNGVHIKISECVRTVEEQDALYAQGRTAPGCKVTNARGSSYSSQHQWGIAADFYLDMDVDGDGQKSDDAFNDVSGLFSQVGAIAKSIGLGWGGDWKKPVDKPHLYLPDWGKTPTPLKQQYGTPEQFMAAWGNVPVSDPDPAPGPAQKPGAEPAPAPAAPSDQRRGNPVIRDGQIHSNNFTRHIITVDGLRGRETKAQAARVVQAAINRDYEAGIAEDGKFGEKSREALGSHTVREGETQQMVTALEICLMLKGYDPKGVEDPGVFGSGLKACVLQYQKDQGLKEDGVAGKKTFLSLIG